VLWAVRSGGVEGNERLTAVTAVVLLVLLAIEGVTILFIRPLISAHVFIGMLLVPPVLLKLGATGYRFLRYYQRRGAYVEKGPPHPLMRLVVAPVLVLSTVAVLGTGVAMIAVGRHGTIVGLHKVSFVVWIWVFGIHVLVYLRRLLPLLRPDRGTGGAAARAGLIGVSLLAGVALAAATLPLARPWLHHRGDGHRDDAPAARGVTRTAASVRRPAAGRAHARRAEKSPAARALGLPPVGPGPVPGYVLIADRNADKLLLVSPSKRIVWQFPRAGDLRRGQSFYNPDDAFFTPGYRRVVTNEEFNDTVAQIDVRTRRLVWSYGRAGVAGSAAGELSNPDDAYVWPNRTITVADIRNCRVLRLSPAHRIVAEIGGRGCAHDPPRALSSPNGATPLRDGGILVTEIGGWVDRLDRHGRLVFSVRTPTTYPSDAQLLPGGNILVAGFDTPGRVDEITPRGRIVWTYGPAAGPGALDRPSLAVRWPNGMIAITDDWHHRIVVVDPRTKRIVWQYGHLGVPSATTGYLSKPDGLDLLPATVGHRAATRRLAVRQVGSLPSPASRLAAAPLPGGRIVAAGGLVGGTSSRQILLGTPSRLRLAGTLPAATHDAALAVLGPTAYVFGGGEAVSTGSIDRIELRSGTARRAGSLGEPLSDLGAATAGGRVYLVGGYTGSRYATAVLRFRPRHSPVVVARLPAGLRYAGIAAIGRTIYVAGGVTTAGESDAVLAVDPLRGRVRRVATLPAPVAHAPLAAVGGVLYLVGGADVSGAPLDRVLRIDPATGSVTTAGRLPVPLADAAAVVSRGRVIVLGGAGTAPSRAVLALTPRTGPRYR
jgi:outer membrane protein assembly factor BamB